MIDFNVAQLLKDVVGAHRDYDYAEPELALSEDMTAHEVRGHVRFTKLNKSILAKGKVRADVQVQCGRCLEYFTTAIATDFEDRYYPTVDVVSGHPVPFGDEAANGEEEVDALEIDHNHHLDLGELLRQVIILALPIMPVCRPDCPGLPAPSGIYVHLNSGADDEDEDDEPPIDSRLAALALLLEDDQPNVPFSKN